MVTYVVDTETKRRVLLDAIKRRPAPFTVDVVKGAHRTTEQNRLQRLWINEIAAQLGDRTPEEVRGECKLTLGVPILRDENTAFRERYDTIIRPLSYAAKLALMMEPIDLPVTRIMTTDQKTRYLDAIARHYGEQGVILTQPEKPLRRRPPAHTEASA